MKTLLTHAYFLQGDPKEQQVNKPYPPLGLLYLSAWLDKHDYENEVFDSTFSNKEKQRDFITNYQPNIIAIYANLITKMKVIELVRFLRKQPNLKNSLIVLGGPDVTYNVENYLAFGVDVLIIGEGEQSLLAIVQAVEKGLSPHFGHIPGLAYKEIDGKIIRTSKRSHLKDINELPIPNRQKIDLSLYFKLWRKHHGQSSISLSTQRGCPYTCRWCSTAVYGQSYRRRSPALVVKEMLQLKKQYDFDQFWFVDDVFTVSHKWLAEFHEQLQLQNVHIPFECITRADRVNEEVLKLLKKCGCFRVWIGAESGSQKILDAMDRRVSVQKVQDIIITARQYGIETGTFIMLGYPSETEKDIQLTLQHLCKSNPDNLTITLAYPIKGTSLYNEVENKFVKDLDWFTSTDRDLDFVRTYPRPYYDFAIRWVINGFNYHKQKTKGNLLSLATLKFKIKMVLARIGMRYYR